LCGLVGREEARIWRGELVFERWLGEVEQMQDVWRERVEKVKRHHQQEELQQARYNAAMDRKSERNGIDGAEMAHEMENATEDSPDGNGNQKSESQLLHEYSQYTQTNNATATTTESADLILEQSMQTFHQLLNSSTPHNNNPPHLSDHQLFSQLVKLIYSILQSQPLLIDSIYVLLRFVFLLREQYLRELHDVLQHVQRIKLRKNDERDVYKCVYSYTREDQGTVDNDVLFELREDLSACFLNPLGVLMSDTRVALMKMLDTVRRRIQEGYRRKIEQYAIERASYAKREVSDGGNANSNTTETQQRTIHLEFTDELIASSNAPQLIEMSHPGLNMSTSAQVKRGDISVADTDEEQEAELSPRLDEPDSHDIHHEASKVHTENVQRHAIEVQEWIDRHIFWKEKKVQLHEQRVQEIDEHLEYMKKYSQQVRQQQDMFERIKETENAEVIERWRAAITLQCCFRRYNSLRWRDAKLDAISLLQRVFRFHHARRVLRNLAEQQKFHQNMSEQQMLWRRRQQIQVATEIPDSQVVYCHIMLRKEMQETERQMEDELVEYKGQWERFAKKSHKEMLKRPLKPEWSEQVDAETGKKMYMNIITGHIQHAHPNMSNIRKYLATEEKRHQEALENRQESLRAYRDQLIQQEVVHRSEFVKVYEEALRNVSGIDFSKRSSE